MSCSQIDSVPMLDLKRQYRLIGDQMDDALKNVNQTGQFILGPEVAKLEENIAQYSKVNYAVGCASGSDALLLSIMAAKVGPGDEVIVPSFTFFASASCIARLGATIKLVDISHDSFCLDPQSVQANISERTKAIIAVHLFGQAADMVAIQEIVKDAEKKYGHKIYVIEDSAQAIGAELNGVSVGNWGDLSCLSFYPTKNLGGAGDGGMVLGNNKELVDYVKLLRGHGMAPRYYHKVIGINSRLDSYQAAILNVKLPYLDQWIASRQEVSARYSKLFTDAKLTDKIVLPIALPNRRHVWHQYVIRVLDGKRNDLRAFLAQKKIGSDIYYPLGVHQQECFAYLGYKPQDLPETLKAANEVLALPIFPELTYEEQIYLVKTVAEFFA
ncbi:MAG: DegT/DnrJ/EryC1/StrS family aminotransferase [Planctomycetia bacterium]|nr:DegT/DnrJ/EryC1/StrS family aminotransferase [Planctomycetia bacterium]